MVEFSGRNDIEAWLKGRPQADAVVLAARAALRCAPALAGATIRGRRIKGGYAAAIVLPTFRAMAAPWAAATYPALSAELASAASAASAAASASYAASAASAASASYAASASAAYAASYASYASFASASDAAFAADASALVGGLAADRLVLRPLWSEDTPDLIMPNWDRLKSALLERNEDWDVWTDWYEDRLYGRSPLSQSVEIARVTLDKSFWDDGPKAVNAEIKRLIEEDGRKRAPPPDQTFVVPPPRRAAIEPVWIEGRVTLPTTALPSTMDVEALTHALALLRAELADLADATDGEANIDSRHVVYFRKLVDRIPTGAPTQL